MIYRNQKVINSGRDLQIIAEVDEKDKVLQILLN